MNDVRSKPFDQFRILQVNNILLICGCRYLRHFRILHCVYVSTIHYEVLIRGTLHGLLIDQSIGRVAVIFHGLAHALVISFGRVNSHRPLPLSVRILPAIIVEVLVARTALLKANWVWSVLPRRVKCALLGDSISHCRHHFDRIVVGLRRLFRIALIPA